MNTTLKRAAIAVAAVLTPLVVAASPAAAVPAAATPSCVAQSIQAEHELYGTAWGRDVIAFLHRIPGATGIRVRQLR